MKSTAIPILPRRLKLFLALSRTPHGVLDMATPAFAVLLYLGAFPSPYVVTIGLLTAFAGYTAVYALNDVVDYRSDREKSGHEMAVPENYLDAAGVRHPMAQGLLTLREGAVWAGGWAAVALVGAWLLNPMCVAVFLTGVALEVIYCVLWRISPWRAAVSGMVKNSGAVAALFAVDPSPSLYFTITLFLCLFFWEIGGQNIPADWTDLEMDRFYKAQTIPVRLGPRKSARLALASLSIAVIAAVALFAQARPDMRWIVAAVVLLTGMVLLIAPACRLVQTGSREAAMALFNKASCFPPTLLGISLILIL